MKIIAPIIGFMVLLGSQANQPLEESCLICSSLDTFRAVISKSQQSANMKTEIKSFIDELEQNRQLNHAAFISFKARNVCAEPDTMALRQIPDRQLIAYNALVGATQTCSGACSIGINDAEYCSFGQHMKAEADMWSSLEIKFTQATIMLESATAGNGSVLAELSQTVDGADREAQDVLRQQFEALSGQEFEPGADVRIKTAAADFHSVSSALEAFHWAGLVSGNGLALAAQLSISARRLEALENDTYLALTRTAVLQPSDRVTLLKRTLELAAQIDFIRMSLKKSVEEEQTALARQPATVANAIPPRPVNNHDLHEITTCFSKMALEASLIPTLGQAVRSELENCRSFKTCQKSTFKTPTDARSISRLLLHSVDEDEKTVYAVRASVCQ